MPRAPRAAVRQSCGRLRALIVTNMWPVPGRPELGSFVRDQVRALERLPGLELELFSLAPGGAAAYALGGPRLRRCFGSRRFDVVHAHFGLSAWPALAARAELRGVTLHGTDLVHPRSRALTLAALRGCRLVGAVSQPLARLVPRWAAPGGVQVLPCGVDTDRFRPLPRAQAREALGLAPEGPYLLFPADPRRAEKRVELARQLAGEVPLLTLGGIAPERVPLLVNAANAVLVTSERESFGLAVLEALSCDVPVLATPHGIAPEALAGIAGAHCGPFEPTAWQRALAPHLAAADPRVTGRSRALEYSAQRMAERLLDAWERGLAGGRR
jgi:teichuronic acid biosynthesis glycosyltransferase TuaC